MAEHTSDSIETLGDCNQNSAILHPEKVDVVGPNENGALSYGDNAEGEGGNIPDLRRPEKLESETSIATDMSTSTSHDTGFGSASVSEISSPEENNDLADNPPSQNTENKSIDEIDGVVSYVRTDGHEVVSQEETEVGNNENLPNDNVKDENVETARQKETQNEIVENAAPKEIDETIWSKTQKEIEDEVVKNAAKIVKENETVQNAAQKEIEHEVVEKATKTEIVDETVQNETQKDIEDEIVENTVKEEIVDEIVQNVTQKEIVDEVVDNAAQKEIENETVQRAIQKEINDEIVENAAQKEIVDEIVQNVTQKEIVDEVVDNAAKKEIVGEPVQNATQKEIVDEIIENAAKIEIVDEIIQIASPKGIEDETIENILQNETKDEADENVSQKDIYTVVKNAAQKEKPDKNENLEQEEIKGENVEQKEKADENNEKGADDNAQDENDVSAIRKEETNEYVSSRENDNEVLENIEEAKDYKADHEIAEHAEHEEVENVQNAVNNLTGDENVVNEEQKQMDHKEIGSVTPKLAEKDIVGKTGDESVDKAENENDEKAPNKQAGFDNNENVEIPERNQASDETVERPESDVPEEDNDKKDIYDTTSIENVQHAAGDTAENDKVTDDKEKESVMDILGNGLLKKKVLVPGKGVGTRPSTGDIVTLKIDGQLPDGTHVDTGEITFNLSDGDVILAFDLATALMEDGEKCELFTSERYAYGSLGRDPDIPKDISITYVLELVNVQKPPDVTEISYDQRLKMGEAKRERGNYLFGRADYSGAINSYNKAVKLLDNAELNEGIDESSQAVLTESWVKCYNNLAACQLKIDALDAATKSCEKVLLVQENNVKALFRLGKAYGAKGEVDKALKYLRQAIRLDPESKLMQQEMLNLTRRKNKETETEKALYQRMLGVKPGDKSSVTDDDKRKGNSNRLIKWTLVAGGIAAVLISVGLNWYRNS